MNPRSGRLLCGLALLMGAPALHAESPFPEGIYTCVDARGRALTSDRPIPACMDREQRVLTPGGTVKAIVAPRLSEQEQEALAEKARQQAAQRERELHERRKDDALLMRYPDRRSHDEERAQHLAQIDMLRGLVFERMKELQKQRAALKQELEFYDNDLSKAPHLLRQQFANNEESQKLQESLLRQQEAEKQKINEKFDAELRRLEPRWGPRQAD